MDALHRILFAVVLCSLPALIASPTSGQADSAVRAPTTTGLYVGEGPDLRPIDASTFADIPLAADINLGDASFTTSPGVLSSPDGSRLAAVSGSSIRVLDPRTGAELAGFHPAESAGIDGISNDGSQIYGFSPRAVGAGRMTWYVLDGSDGHLISKTHRTWHVRRRRLLLDSVRSLHGMPCDVPRRLARDRVPESVQMGLDRPGQLGA